MIGLRSWGQKWAKGHRKPFSWAIVVSELDVFSTIITKKQALAKASGLWVRIPSALQLASHFPRMPSCLPDWKSKVGWWARLNILSIVQFKKMCSDKMNSESEAWNEWLSQRIERRKYSEWDFCFAAWKADSCKWENWKLFRGTHSAFPEKATSYPF